MPGLDSAMLVANAGAHRVGYVRLGLPVGVGAGVGIGGVGVGVGVCVCVGLSFHG